MMSRTQLLLTFGIAAAFYGSTALAVEAPDPALKAQAKITQTDAEQTALAKVPGGKIKDGELETEHGKLIWSFDIAKPKTSSITEVQVDAITGKIVSTKIETVKDQAREIKADKKEAAKKAAQKDEAAEEAKEKKTK
jgi:hypothetical protein